jgi:two-component system sensor histidine kinase YesM
MIIKNLRIPLQFIQNSLPFKKFEQLSLKNKLLILFIFVSILPLLLLQTFSYYNSTISMRNKINELIHFNLVQTAKNLDTTLTSYEDLLIQIFSDDALVEQVKKLNASSDVERLLAAIEIKRRFSIISLSKPGVKCISVLANSGQVAWYDRDNNSGFQNIWSKYSDVTQSKVYRSSLHSSHWVLTGPDSDYYLGNEYHFVNIALKLLDWKSSDNKFLGIVVLSVDEDSIYNSCNQAMNDTKKIDSFNFIYDRQGRIVSFPVKKYLGKRIIRPDQMKSGNESNQALLKFIRQVNLIGNRQLIINRLQQEKNGWTIVNVIDQNYLFNQMYWMQRFNIVFAILAVLFSVIVIIYVTSTLTRSTHKIISAMNIAREGELSVQVKMDTKDEIAMIGFHFNLMMVRIQQLMEEVKSATGREKEAEIRALVAQINPHFLYNILDSINWMAIEKDEHEISQMIESLANILRYSINDSNWVVTLQEEVEWLNQYIYLLQNHFEYSFVSVIEFEENMLTLKIYKLLLQPLVENAIIHGFKGLQSGGILKITGIRMGEFIKIVVEDNGKGMSRDTLELISMDLQERRSFSGIGIKNVSNRLRIYYGKDASLDFSSQIGVGTVVTLVLPVL